MCMCTGVLPAVRGYVIPLLCQHLHEHPYVCMVSYGHGNAEVRLRIHLFRLPACLPVWLAVSEFVRLCDVVTVYLPALCSKHLLSP